MSTPYPQQPAGQSAVPAQPAAPAQAAQPVQQAPQGVPQAGAPAQSTAPAQSVPQGVQGYSMAPQGGAPGYAPVPQGPVVQKANRLSIILGVVGWGLIGLTILATWLAIAPICSAILWLGEPRRWYFRDRGGRRKAQDTQAQLAGNPPQCEPVRHFHSPHVLAAGAPWSLSCGSSHASMTIVGARPTMACSQGRMDERMCHIAAMVNS